LETREWLSKLKTAVDGIELIDPGLLPPSFSGEIFAPVREQKGLIDDLGRRVEMLELLNKIGTIGREGVGRAWYVWESLCKELCAFVGAEQAAVYRLASQGQLHKIHPLLPEEESVDWRLPPGLEGNPAAAELPDIAQSIYLHLGTGVEHPVVLLFQRKAPFPRLREPVLALLAEHEAVLFDMIEPHLPAPAQTRQLEITGASVTIEQGAILGNDPSILQAIESISQAAESDATVYLRGESGTGKELFAKHLHDLSARADKPFIPINCSAIPHELIESEMFGHEKGAFTGAYYRKIGKAEQANGGTLFLDEIGEMPLAFQAKLLRFLQEKKFTRVGGNNQVESDARIVVATHRDLQEMVGDKSFREDLYYRIHVIPVRIPPLRERGRDIRLLAEAFFSKYISKSRASRRQVDETVFDVLERYAYPGNVRQLDNIIQRTVVMTQKPVISAEDLPDEVFSNTVNADKLYRLHPFEKLDHLLPEDRETLKDLKKEVEHIGFSYQRDLDRRFLLRLLDENNGSARKAAEAANINRTLFYKLLKRAGLDINILNKAEG